MVKIYFLGLGGWASNPFIGHTSFLLASKTTKLLVDAGEGTYSSLRKCTPYDIGDIDYILVTHIHGDHMLGIPTILQQAKRLGVKVRIVGLEGVYEALRKLLESVGISKYINVVDFIKIEEMGRVELGDVGVTTIAAHHTVPSVMIKLDVDGKCVAYSGDSSPNETFFNQINGCDVLIHEASVSDELRDEAMIHGHSSVGDVVAFAEKSGIKHLILVHRGVKPLIIRRTSLPIIIVHKCDVVDI